MRRLWGARPLAICSAGDAAAGVKVGSEGCGAGAASVRGGSVPCSARVPTTSMPPLPANPSLRRGYPNPLAIPLPTHPRTHPPTPAICRCKPTRRAAWRPATISWKRGWWTCRAEVGAPAAAAAQEAYESSLGSGCSAGVPRPRSRSPPGPNLCSSTLPVPIRRLLWAGPRNKPSAVRAQLRCTGGAAGERGAGPRRGGGGGARARGGGGAGAAAARFSAPPARVTPPARGGAAPRAPAPRLPPPPARFTAARPARFVPHTHSAACSSSQITPSGYATPVCLLV